MPTLTLTRDTATVLELSRGQLLLEPTLMPLPLRRLEAMLVTRGFDVTRAVYVRELANGEGFLLTQ
jgi:hypothetical protein